MHDHAPGAWLSRAGRRAEVPPWSAPDVSRNGGTSVMSDREIAGKIAVAMLSTYTTHATGRISAGYRRGVSRRAPR